MRRDESTNSVHYDYLILIVKACQDNLQHQIRREAANDDHDSTHHLQASPEKHVDYGDDDHDHDHDAVHTVAEQAVSNATKTKTVERANPRSSSSRAQ